MTHKETAENIVAQGGQILLPFEVGDAQVVFPSRWRLAELITQALNDAVEDARVFKRMSRK